MELPEPLLSAVKKLFDGHHPYWHLARVQESEMPNASARAAWKAARQMFPTLKFRDEPGAGAEFLTFHRDMMREYKWLLEQFPDVKISYQPWTSIPDDVANFIEKNFNVSAGHVNAGSKEIDKLIKSGSLDELGAFMEPCPDDNQEFGAGLHDLAHGAVSYIEEGNGLARDFSMGSPSTAHRNKVFYQLHGWIDECYAAWQTAHNQSPDTTPKAPGEHGGHVMGHAPTDEKMLKDAIETVDTILRFERAWKR
ncbi:hypothetical protein [uncultured Pseudomonas sp.]|uniref:hypothetical protein n=1 Tax=uncultured Pseudomonas sp. TaxID=114707 RepID=UPI002590139F|nr:hypothetical protein [uncultured Pseudomonas sp.]